MQDAIVVTSREIRRRVVDSPRVVDWNEYFAAYKRRVQS